MVRVGVLGPPPPPVLIVPAPLKLMVPARIFSVPVRLGKDPVAPARLPVPAVTVAEPVRLPVSADNGIFSVPVIVPVVPLVTLIVNVPLRFCEESGVVGIEPLNVPLPIPVRVAGPVAD